MTDPVDGDVVGTTWTARDLPLEDALGVVRECGLAAVEVWAEGVHLDPRAGGHRRASVRRVLDSGLAVASVHLPFHGVAIGAPADVRADDWVNLCAETLHSAAELGARTAVVHPVIFQESGESGRVGVVRLTRALHRIAGTAATVGVRLAVENMHVLRGPTLRSVDEIMPVLRQADPSAGICLDVGHAIFNGFTGARLGGEVRSARGHLLSTHVHDSDRIGADPHLVPGDGIADWQTFIRTLTDIGYRGPFVLEVDGGPDPVERLTRARTRFHQLLRHHQFEGAQ